MNNKFLKKTIIYFIGNLSSKLLSAILIPIYAFFVSPEDLGNFDYVMALMNIIIPIVFLNIWDSILKYGLVKNEEKNKKKIYSSSFFLIIFNITVFIIVYIIIYKFSLITYPYFILSIVMMVSYGLFSYWQYASRSFKENGVFALSGVISSGVNVFLICVFVIFLKKGLLGLIIAYTISMISGLLVIESKIKLRKYITASAIDFSLLKEMCLFSFPIMLNTVSLWGMSGISKIICVNYLSAGINGVYSFANKFGALITVFGSIIGAVIIEEAYLEKSIESYAKRFSKIIQKLATIYFQSLMIIIPFVNIAYDVFLRNGGYYESKVLIPLVTTSAIFASLATNFGSAFQVTNKTSLVFITSLVGSLVNLGLSFYSVNKFGIIGLVISQMLGNLTLMLVRYYGAYKLTRLKIKFKRISFLVIQLATICIVSNTISLIGNAILSILIIILYLFIYRRKIKYLIERS